MQFPIKEVPLFVYGNLRSGIPLHDGIKESVRSSRSGTIRGRLYWHDGGTYPLFVPDETGYPVHGELLTCTASPAVADMILREELLYGYEARWLSVTFPDDEVADCLVLTWPQTTGFGEEITSGDYRTQRRTTEAEQAHSGLASS